MKLPAWRAALLATTSAAALFIGAMPSAMACTISNTAPVNNTTPADCITLNNGSVFTGDLTNNSTLTTAPTGISVLAGTRLNGSIINTNNGTISATQAGISVKDASIGSVINSGTITSGSAGIFVSQSSVAGSVSNGGTITGGIGQIVADNTTVAGSVENSGTIIVSVYTGLGVYRGGQVAGNIVNSGTIASTDLGVNVSMYIGGQSVGGSIVNSGKLNGWYGIAVTGSSAAGHPAIVAGNIANTGTINASNRSGMALFTVTVGGDVINSGTITAGRNGIRLVNTTGAVGGATVAGGIKNSGTIVSSGAGFNGIALIGASVSQGITNSGAVTAQGAGILVEGGEILGGKNGLHGSGTTAVQAGPPSMVPGSLTNSGAVSAQTGILVNSSGVVAGGITNSGHITGSVSAINVIGEGAATTISQTGGTITGNVLLSTLADTVNVLGGVINGNIVGAGSSNTINFAPGDGKTFTYASPFGFSGINQVNVSSGTLVLNGSNSATNVTVTGSVLEVGNASAPGATLTAAVSVNNLGTLSGFGTVAGAVTINSGGTLSPGDAPGTITVGPLTLNAGSMLLYQLGTPNVVGGPTNDLTNVNGALTINGDTLFVTNSASFAPGTYRLIDYTTGTAPGGIGTIVVGTLPDGDTGVIQTSISGEVNLIVTASPPSTQFWDGTTMVGDGTVHGGNGTWNNTSTNWTTSTGTPNSSWQGISAVFAGAAGTVTVADTISYQSIQFSTDGYVLTASAGGTLVPTGVAPIIVDGLLTATIGAPITGSGGVDKTGLGTLIITGADTYTGGTTITAGTLQLGNGGTTGSIVGNVTNNDILAFDRSDIVTFPGIISGTGGVEQIGTGTTILTADNAYTGGTAILAGTLQLGNGGASASILGNVANDGTMAFDRSNVVTFPGIISGTGVVQQIGTGTTILTADDTYTGGTTIAAGTLQLGNGGTTGSIVGNVTDNGTLAFDRSDTVTFGGVISGTGTVQQIGAGLVVLTADNTYTGGTTINAGTSLQLGIDGTTGSIIGNVTDNGTLAFDRSDVLTFPGVISGTGAVQQIGTGTLVLSAANSYTGPTNVASGILDVTGSIARSSLTTVASGATLTGTGTVGNVQIDSGATLAPGNGTPGTFMTVAGNLAFQSGALYMVQVSPATASFTTVTGTASLNGKVDAVFAPGSYVGKQYLILQSAGLGGTTFSGLTTVGLPTGFIASLSYSPDDAFLNLTAALGAGTVLNVNQRNVATALNNFFNSGQALPPNFANLFGLSGPALANTLTQLSGEVATGAERSSFELTNQFLNLMLTPYVATSGFAPAQPVSPPPAVYKAPVFKAPVPTFEQRWTVWAAGFGGSGTANGDPVVGSNNVTTSTFGYAAGMDYHYSPDTVFGFALAGGGTNWGLAQGLGSGRSDAFLAGIHGITHQGPVYLAGALAFANNWFSTERTALGEPLNASFQGQDYAGRLEGGYRFAVPLASNTIGITPYAAIQAQDFHTPAYSETDVTAGGFGLSYDAKNGTDTRSELGGRFDDLTALGGMPLQLRAKLAWAHDWVSNPSLNASFESLPGTNFTAFGAPIPHNSALASAGAQLFFTPNWSLIAKFDGEFASGSQFYAGSGTLRYTW